MADIKSEKKYPPALDERKLAVLKAQQAKEKVFKLVVKIISWETASLDSIAMRSLDKISKQEWDTYKKYFANISKAEGPAKIKEKLTQSYNAIKEQKGFK